MRLLAPAIALLIAAAVGLYTIEPGPAEIAGRTMGSTWSVRLTAPAPRDLAAQVQARLDALEAEMSTWKSDSAISRFNAATSTEWFTVSRDFAAVVTEAHRVSGLTGGAFDITVAPLVELWGFGPRGRAEPPADQAIAATVQHVGYQKIEVRSDPPAIRKLDPAAAIDLSALAPGYAADVLADLLEARGIRDYLVDVGGELHASGYGGFARGWRVGIESPAPGSRIIQRRITMPPGGLATSGDYRDFIDAGGRRYSHFIDPRTGRPVESPLASVSILAGSTMTADALATALMVLGPDAGLALAKEMKLPALFIVRRGAGLEEKMTKPFEELLADLEGRS